MRIKDESGSPSSILKKGLLLVERSGVHPIDGHCGNKQYLRGVILSPFL